MNKRPTLKEFIVFAKKVHSFFDAEQAVWADRLLFEGLEDVSFIRDVMPVLSLIECDFSHTDIDKYSSFLRKKCDFYLEKVQKSKNLNDRFNAMSKAFAYFGLTEVLHETGPFSEKVFAKLKQELGSNYLEKLAELDKKFLSADSAKFLKKRISYNFSENLSDAIKEYIVLKIWQDNQHAYFPEKMDSFVWNLDEEYKVKQEEKPYYPDAPKQMNNVNAQKIRFLNWLAKKELIDIDDVSMGYLAGLNKELIKIVGGKAYGLAVLNAYGIKIPETYVIPTTHNLRQLKSKSFDVLTDTHNYAVRSSADIEDGSSYSFAGMFDSYLNISKKDLFSYIQHVQDSINNQRVKTYIGINKLEIPHMAVVIQKFKEPTKAGVWISSSCNSGVLEWVNGNGEKLVSGRINPNREVWSDKKASNQVLTVCNKPLGLRLIEMQKNVSKTGTADFEWCLLDGELVMTQFRPVTKIAELSEHSKEIFNDKDKVYKGIPVSPGYVEGPAKFVRRVTDITHWNDKDILMAWFTDPDWMNILTKSSGVVTAIGGFLCHTAIIAREMGIPCIVGIGSDSMKKIWDKSYLCIDGTKGIVSTNVGKVLKLKKERSKQHD